MAAKFIRLSLGALHLTFELVHFIGETRLMLKRVMQTDKVSCAELTVSQKC